MDILELRIIFEHIVERRAHFPCLFFFFLAFTRPPWHLRFEAKAAANTHREEKGKGGFPRSEQA